MEGLADLSPSKGSKSKGNAQYGTATYGAVNPPLAQKFRVDRSPNRTSAKPGPLYSYTTNIQAPFDFRPTTKYTPAECAKLGLKDVIQAIFEIA